MEKTKQPMNSMTSTIDEALGIAKIRPAAVEKKYVVVREGRRVSDREYFQNGDAAAIAEKTFWKKVAKNHSHNEPVEIVQYDSRLHRVW